MADHTSGELLVLKDFVGDEFNTRSHDIVAVHGWCCSQGVSWAYQGKDGTWLQNLLPTYIGPSRVMTFNYCVDSEHGISTSTTRHIALSLLAQLLKFETDGSRNLVFIGHDVGGVVIKQVFFGTPHRALNLGDWEEMVCRMILTGSKRHLGRLTEVISTSSRALKKASNDFRTLERVYTVVNIFEDGGHDPVVSPFSATFGQEGEQKTQLLSNCVKWSNIRRVTVPPISIIIALATVP
ncbi:hypothetical protein F4819DRAFT_143153 [Hypoxylon fuscum]|nr:hypothetical protein F4819DRAFT_143153 [Hypoxylon fuscum]